ncbi:hypothetical protein FQA39_LY12386 [Lamprigera yunnana]|nr:hypothetical protein FQA39_LY12386 [Lamprigera yunnana]
MVITNDSTSEDNETIKVCQQVWGIAEVIKFWSPQCLVQLYHRFQIMLTLKDINTKNDKEVNLPIKLTKQRWTILFLFVLSSALNNMQWMQYSVIADVIVKHYDVSHEAVNWTSMVFLLFYGLFILPGNYILEKFGIRKSVLLSSLLNCIGCWIKIFSVGQDKFWLVIIGQSVVALATMCVVSAPAVIAAEWFGSDEVALACSISLNGIMLGIAAGILTSSLTVSSGSVEHDLFTMLLIIALITTSVLVVQLIFFSDKPKNPPSKAQLEQLARKKSSNFLRSTLRVFKNVRYLVHLIAFGINYGISCSFAVLLNQMLSNYYINASVEVGRIGAIISFSGIFGSILCGIVLDKFKQYKVTYIILQSGCIVSMLLFTYNLGNSLTIVYLISAMFG